MKLTRGTRLESKKITDKILKHLVDIQELDLVILKGHLLVEYCLELAIKSLAESAQNELRIEGKKMTFYNKLLTCDILGLFFIQKHIFEDINNLNDIRNDLAHGLEYNQNQINGLFKHYSKEMKSLSKIKPYQLRVLNKVKFVIAKLCAEIIRLADLQVQLNNYCLDNLPEDFTENLEYLKFTFDDEKQVEEFLPK